MAWQDDRPRGRGRPKRAPGPPRKRGRPAQRPQLNVTREPLKNTIIEEVIELRELLHVPDDPPLDQHAWILHQQVFEVCLAVLISDPAAINSAKGIEAGQFEVRRFLSFKSFGSPVAGPALIAQLENVTGWRPTFSEFMNILSVQSWEPDLSYAARTVLRGVDLAEIRDPFGIPERPTAYPETKFIIRGWQFPQ